MYLNIYQIKLTLFINLIKKSSYKLFAVLIINIKKILKLVYKFCQESSKEKL
jgi:hypothetical protein